MLSTIASHSEVGLEYIVHLFNYGQYLSGENLLQSNREDTKGGKETLLKKENPNRRRMIPQVKRKEHGLKREDRHNLVKMKKSERVRNKKGKKKKKRNSWQMNNEKENSGRRNKERKRQEKKSKERKNKRNKKKSEKRSKE